MTLPDAREKYTTPAMSGAMITMSATTRRSGNLRSRGQVSIRVEYKLPPSELAYAQITGRATGAARGVEREGR
jgi:hypothetical protein